MVRKITSLLWEFINNHERLARLEYVFLAIRINALSKKQVFQVKKSFSLNDKIIVSQTISEKLRVKKPEQAHFDKLSLFY